MGDGIIKKIVIAGCRTFSDYERAREAIGKIIKSKFSGENVKIISGGCRGADKLGERYAHENGLKLTIYNAEWDKYGRAAGPKRNEKMANAADYIICFWDGKSRGTKSMIELANKYKKQIFIIKIP